jgi:hypothetical protein
MVPSAVNENLTFPNPKAGNAEFKVTQLISQLEDAGYDVLYESIKEKGKAPFASQLIERLSLTETGRSVGLLLGWLDDSLSKFGFVVGLISFRDRQTEDQTNWCLAALRNKSIHVLSHPRRGVSVAGKVCEQISVCHVYRTLVPATLIVLCLYSKAHSMCNDTSTRQTDGEAVSG